MASTIKVGGKNYLVTGQLQTDVFDLSTDNPVDEKTRKLVLSRLRARTNKRERDDALRGLGLKKVRGALGGIYWE